MLDVDSRPVDAQLVSFVRQWFDLMADGRASAACALLDEPNSYGIRWTPEQILAVVHETFGAGTAFGAQHPGGPVFTRPAETAGNPHANFGSIADDSGFWIDHAVPLNGQWSDLTAQFEFLRRGDRLAVVLHDLHVL
jgi:hypothetical protein